MARGVAYSWKQPIAYLFYKSTAPPDEAKDILFETVRKLNAIGLNVLGVVSDQGPNFQKLVKKTLNLTENNPCFFVGNIKLVYLFDIPHLLKSTRNNLFSYIFLSTEGKINKKFKQCIIMINQKTIGYALSLRMNIFILIVSKK